MLSGLLITGGTGFFGRALLRQFHAEAQRSPHDCPQDYSQIIVVSRNPEAFAIRYPELAKANWLRWARADILQRSTLDALLVGEAVSAVLHAATDSTDASALSNVQKLDQIVEGTRNVLDLAIRIQARRLLFTSSGGVYGPQPTEMAYINESYCGTPDPLQTSSTYGIGKRLAEHLCFLYGQLHGIDTVIARCFAFVGQDLPLDAHFAIGNFIRDALQKPSIEVGGNGTPVRTYMDQRDLAYWLIALLKRGSPGQAYNVGSDAEINIHDLAHLVRKTLSPSKPVIIAGRMTDNVLGNRYVPSISKARYEVGLNLTHNLKDSILSVAAEWKTRQLS